MYDKELVVSILEQILDAARKVSDRLETINSAEDFTSSAAGSEKLDAICMLLIAIGESLKNVDKTTQRTLLPKYPEVDWRGAKGLRDIIAHQYFDIDADQIYWVCRHRLPGLSDTIAKMLEDLKDSIKRNGFEDQERRA